MSFLLCSENICALLNIHAPLGAKRNEREQSWSSVSEVPSGGEEEAISPAADEFLIGNTSKPNTGKAGKKIPDLGLARKVVKLLC